MTKRAFWLGIAAAFVALPVMGCDGGKSCKDVCELRNECPDVIPLDTPCEDQCKAREELVKAALCEEKQAVFDECVNKLNDVCEASNRCVNEGEEIYFCLQQYCVDNPSACEGS